MFCNSCGNVINDGAAFCPVCGSGFQAQQQQYSQQQQYGQAQAPYPPPADQQQYGQYGPSAGNVPAQGYAPAPGYPAPPQKKPKTPLFIAAGAAAAVLVFFLVIFPMIGGENAEPADGFDIDIGTEDEGAPEPMGNDSAVNDPDIGVIEVNQALSYGFDADTGEFYLMDNFVAGKETAVFVSLAKEPDPNSEIKLTIEREGETVGTLLPEKTDDPALLLFQPKDMKEVGGWEQGNYTFTFTMDDKYTVRETKFHKTDPIKILVVPFKANYGGEIVSCEGEWKNSGEMLIACYPLGKDDIEFVYGQEVDLSHERFDLADGAGMYRVWRELCKLQTPDEDYTLIVGFMRKPTSSAKMKTISGWTYGLPATICCETIPAFERMIPHETAHCYCIGDEYPTSLLNLILNVPPYGMEGYDYFTYEPTKGNKEKVLGGKDVGLEESGSVIYPEQRAYWVERRLMPGLVTSFMSMTSGNPAEYFWITSDIWNHLFRVFTGQIKGEEPGYVPRKNGDNGEFYGVCNYCNADVYEPRVYIKCPDCSEFISAQTDPVVCRFCTAEYSYYDFDSDVKYLECPQCWEFILYSDFKAFNSGGGETAKGSGKILKGIDAPSETDWPSTY